MDVRFKYPRHQKREGNTSPIYALLLQLWGRGEGVRQGQALENLYASFLFFNGFPRIPCKHIHMRRTDCMLCYPNGLVIYIGLRN